MKPKKKVIFIIMILVFTTLSALFYLKKAGYLADVVLFKSMPEKLREECRIVMGKNDCVIMQNTAFLPPEVKQVFVSGYGSLSADTYRSLKSAGIYMCDQIRDACVREKSSEACRLGQALYNKN